MLREPPLYSRIPRTGPTVRPVTPRARSTPPSRGHASSVTSNRASRGRSFTRPRRRTARLVILGRQTIAPARARHVTPPESLGRFDTRPGVPRARHATRALPDMTRGPAPSATVMRASAGLSATPGRKRRVPNVTIAPVDTAQAHARTATQWAAAGPSGTRLHQAARGATGRRQITTGPGVRHATRPAARGPAQRSATPESRAASTPIGASRASTAIRAGTPRQRVRSVTTRRADRPTTRARRTASPPALLTANLGRN